jgi:hypothetical protein
VAASGTTRPKPDLPDAVAARAAWLLRATQEAVAALAEPDQDLAHERACIAATLITEERCDV